MPPVEGVENCYACGHKVWAEYDEDGTPVVYRPIEAEAAALSDSALREALEAEWYNGNLDEKARDRLLALLAQPTPDDKPSLDEPEGYWRGYTAGMDAVRSRPRSPAEGADDEDVHLASIRQDVLNQWLQSPEAESRLAAVLHKFPPYSESTAFVEERARSILSALTKP